MVNIDYIMDLLDWYNSAEQQEQGMKLAQSVKCINVFLQPCTPCCGKNVWGNCAKILAARSNEELSPYLIELMEWLRGMVNDPLFLYSYTVCLKYAKALEDEIWERNLRAIGIPAG